MPGSVTESASGRASATWRWWGAALASFSGWVVARRANRAAWATQGAAAEELRCARRRVLVAEDCPVQQLLTCALLRGMGITPFVVANGAEAVAAVGAIEFDLILMDLQMPVLDGVAATLQIRRYECEHALARVPVVAYTSSQFQGSQASLRYVGIDAVLKKPSDAARLRSCLQALWASGEPGLPRRARIHGGAPAAGEAQAGFQPASGCPDGSCRPRPS